MACALARPEISAPGRSFPIAAFLPRACAFVRRHAAVDSILRTFTVTLRRFGTRQLRLDATNEFPRAAADIFGDDDHHHPSQVL